MKTILTTSVLAILLCAVTPHWASAQIVPKVNLKKQGQKVLGKVLGTETEESGESTTASEETTYGSSSPTSAKKGKKLTPPNVTEQLNNAGLALQANRFSDTRFAIKQAMMGIELEIGNQILESLPKEVIKLPYAAEQDQVVSTDMNFAGLVIGREYGANNKSVSAQIVNNSILSASYNMLLTSGYQTNSDEGQKIIMVQGHRALLKFDGESTYELGVPIGQNTIFVLNSYGLSDESEVTTVANAFDFAKIMSLLGEQ